MVCLWFNYDGSCACGGFTIPFSEAAAACFHFTASLIKQHTAQTGAFEGYFPVKETKQSKTKKKHPVVNLYYSSLLFP